MKKEAVLAIALAGLLSGFSLAEEQKPLNLTVGSGIKKVGNSVQNLSARIQLWWLLSNRIASAARNQPKPVVVVPATAKKIEQLYGPHKKTREEMERHNQAVRNRGAQTGDHIYKADTGSAVQF